METKILISGKTNISNPKIENLVKHYKLREIDERVEAAAKISYFENCVFYVRHLKEIVEQKNTKVKSIVFSNFLCSDEDGFKYSTIASFGFANKFLVKPEHKIYYSSEVNQGVKFENVTKFDLDWVVDDSLLVKKVNWTNEPNGIHFKKWISNFPPSKCSAVVRKNITKNKMLRGALFNANNLGKIWELLNSSPEKNNARVALFPVIMRTEVEQIDRMPIPNTNPEVHYPALLDIVTYILVPINKDNMIYYHSRTDHKFLISPVTWPNKWR